MFPVLTLGFGFVAARSMQKVQREGSTIMLLGETNASALGEKIRQTGGIRVIPPSDDFVTRISDKKLHAAVEFPWHFAEEVNANRRPVVKIYDFAGETRSQVAVALLRRILEDYRDQLVEARLMESGLSKDVLKPFESKEENVAPPEKVGGNVVGGLFPYLIIFLCFMGAMAPAIDLTAGEKERGTIETLLASPVRRAGHARGELVLGLFASVDGGNCI